MILFSNKQNIYQILDYNEYNSSTRIKPRTDIFCYSGMKQSGVPLNDVILPVWAKGDSREFIRAHREVFKMSLA